MTASFRVAAQFLRRSHSERKLLLTTAILFAAAHVLVRLRPLANTRRQLQRVAVRAGARANDVQQLAWATDRVNQWLPGRHSCLINALACDAVAHASGIATEFRVGATRAAERHRFHAWVEHQGLVLTGDDNAEFVPLA